MAPERIAGLYAIEGEIRGRTADECCAIRQEKSRPIIDEFEPWLRARLDQSEDQARRGYPIRIGALARP